MNCGSKHHISQNLNCSFFFGHVGKVIFRGVWSESPSVIEETWVYSISEAQNLCFSELLDDDIWMNVCWSIAYSWSPFLLGIFAFAWHFCSVRIWVRRSFTITLIFSALQMWWTRLSLALSRCQSLCTSLISLCHTYIHACSLHSHEVLSLSTVLFMCLHKFLACCYSVCGLFGCFFLSLM